MKASIAEGLVAIVNNMKMHDADNVLAMLEIRLRRRDNNECCVFFLDSEDISLTRKM